MRLQVWVVSAMAKFSISLCKRADGTVNRSMMSFLSVTSAASSNPLRGVSSFDIPVDVDTGVWCRVFVPVWVDPDKKLPLIVFYHGGGFALFEANIRGYDLHCRRMSKMCEAVVVSVSYRLAPEHKFPAAYEDGFTALEWVRSQSRNQPHEDFPAHLIDFSRVFLCGESSGGNLAHHVAVRAGVTDISPMTIAGVILVQPLFGGEERTHSEIRYSSGTMIGVKELDWCWRAFLPSDADRDHPSCNVTGSKAPPFLPMKLPKLLVIVGGKDPLQDKGILYAEMMQSAGKDCKLVFYEKAFHGFSAFRKLEATTALHYEIDEFVNPPTEDGKSMSGRGTEARTPRASRVSSLDRTLSF